MKFYLLLLFTSLTMNQLFAQEALPLQEIPAAPDDFGPGNVVARMVEGLGYRYYWATEGLREEDLAYKISADSRSTGETLDHILGLSAGLWRAVSGTEGESYDYAALSLAEKRAITLNNYARSSEMLRGMKQKDLDKLQIVFGRGDSQRTFPFWNMINGQISDAIYHTGQIVAFRRASGNPMNPKVNVFMGKTRE